MTVEEFVSKWSGKGCDWDGHYGFQCVDLYRQYVQEVVKCPQSPGVSGAKDIWNSYLPEYFERIPNTPDGVPQVGDIMIWGDKYGPYGHVAVVTKATLTTFTCFSQNDPTGALCGLKTYRTYSPTLGWLSPKTPSTSYRGYDLTNLDSMKVCVDDHVKVVEGQLVDKSQYEAIKGQLTESQKQNTELSTQLGGVRGELASSLAKIDTQNKVISSYVNEDAVQIETLKRLERESGEYRDEYYTFLMTTQRLLKLPEKVDSSIETQNVAVDALQKLVQSTDILNGKVKDLEKKLSIAITHQKPIDKLTTKEVIFILVEKLFKRS